MKQTLTSLLLTLVLSSAVFAKAAPTKEKPAPAKKVVAEENNNHDEINDPYEGFNRFMHRINGVVDYMVVRPSAEIYRAALPSVVRQGVRNGLNFLNTPVTFFNSALQNDEKRAKNAFWRFWINGTFGLGVIDMAKHVGMEHEYNGFDRTLAQWGVDSGPILVLPLIGFRDARGAVGYAVDSQMDLWNRWAHNTQNSHLTWWRLGVAMVDGREAVIEDVDAIVQAAPKDEEGLPDTYNAFRSIWHQKSKNMEATEVDGAVAGVEGPKPNNGA